MQPARCPLTARISPRRDQFSKAPLPPAVCPCPSASRLSRRVTKCQRVSTSVSEFLGESPEEGRSRAAHVRGCWRRPSRGEAGRPRFPRALSRPETPRLLHAGRPAASRILGTTPIGTAAGSGVNPRRRVGSRSSYHVWNPVAAASPHLSTLVNACQRLSTLVNDFQELPTGPGPAQSWKNSGSFSGGGARYRCYCATARRCPGRSRWRRCGARWRKRR